MDDEKLHPLKTAPEYDSTNSGRVNKLIDVKISNDDVCRFKRECRAKALFFLLNNEKHEN